LEIELSIGDMDAEIGVDPDQVRVKGRMMNWLRASRSG
jgi:hypothetical protein